MGLMPKDDEFNGKGLC